MLKEFTVGFRTAEAMDFLTVLSMSMEGIGAALFCLSSLFGIKAGIVLGLAFVCLGAIALFIHLGHPLRFWRVISKAASTWISRGAIFTAGLIAFGLLSLLVPDTHLLGMFVKTVALVCAFVVMLYTGLLFSSIPSIPFWNTSWLPILFVSHSMTSGAFFMLVIVSLFEKSIGFYRGHLSLAMALFLFSLVLSLTYVTSASQSAASQESVRSLTQGRLKVLFFGGSVLIGLLLPLAFTVVSYLTFQGLGNLSATLLFIAIPLRFVGDISFRYSLLRAGIYEPII